MSEADPITACTACDRRLARSEMFGLEPDLLCPDCAHGVRKRMQVRVKRRVPDRRPVVTLTILALAGLFFLFSDVFFQYPANFANWPDWYVDLRLLTQTSPLVWQGEVWGLVGAAFWHIDVIHILFNGWWIWDLGRATENGFGRWSLVLLVLGSAAVASAAEWMLNGMGVGLSGVVYALALFLWVHHRTNPAAAAVMNRRTLNFLAMWFVLCIVLTATGTWRIGNWAHGAGAVWGFLAGHAALHARRRLLVPALAAFTITIMALAPHVAFGEQAALRADYLQQVEQKGYTYRDAVRRDVAKARRGAQPR
jgi:membrane associated rhomboid family serine protease